MNAIERKVRDRLIAATQRMMDAKRSGDKEAIRKAGSKYYNWRKKLQLIERGEYPPMNKAQRERLEAIKLLFNSNPQTRLTLDTGEILHGWGLMAEEGGMAESLAGLSDADVLVAYDNFVECGRLEYGD